MTAAGSWLLTLDRGNSTLDCLLRTEGGGSRGERHRLPPDGEVALEALEALIADRRPLRAAGASSVPGGLAPAERRLAGLGVPLQLAGRELSCPLRLDYRTPETLGSDRWVAALAAWRRFGTACVVDAGTAVTVDLVEGRPETSTGTYCGGAIAPGFAALESALAARAPALPPAGGSFRVPPDASADAVAMGVQVGFCGMIERLVEDLVGELRPRPVVVLTGGDLERYLRHGRLAVEAVPDLVHRGLAALMGAPCAS